MRKASILFLLILVSFAVAAQKNVTLLGTLPYSENLNDIWGYVDSAGNEYALVGTRSSLSIVDVSDPANPTELFTIPGSVGTWRDIKTYNDHAYVVNETGGGLLIVDLTSLPGSINSTIWTGDTLAFDRAHNIFIDSNGIAYLFGYRDTAGTILLHDRGALMIDLADPQNPVHVGTYSEFYCHDGFVRGDTMWTAEIYLGQFSVVDVSDKFNPVVLASHSTPNFFTHNVWLSDDGATLFTTDELTNAFVASFDVSDINNISERHRYQSNHSSGVVPHNTHFMNNFLITSYYRDGITIVDATRPGHLVETGFYDTSPLAGSGSGGCWGVYPFLPSGNIIASDIQEGLFVLSPTYVRGCYLEGTLVDSATGNVAPGIKVEIIGATAETITDDSGNYKIGIADSGSYDIRFSHSNCMTRIIQNVNLDNGRSDTLNDSLDCLNLSIIDIHNPTSQIKLEAYPVPFSYSTGIYFEIPEKVKGEKLLTIYNLFGQIIRRDLLLSNQGSINFGNDISSGIYLVEIQAENYRKTIRVIKTDL